MTDRELLEAAAKAAGLWDAREQCIDIPWNPLFDDGDALRLACDLRLEVLPRWRCAEVRNGVEIIIEYCEDEPALRCAATRRAIVRAAAAIGR